MGATTMSFSIAWTRIVPFGKRGSPINEAGLKYVSNPYLVNSILTYFFSYRSTMTLLMN